MASRIACLGAQEKVQNGCVVAAVMDAEVLTSALNIDTVYTFDKYFLLRCFCCWRWM